jgi:hypothetical protein
MLKLWIVSSQITAAEQGSINETNYRHPCSCQEEKIKYFLTPASRKQHMASSISKQSKANKKVLKPAYNVSHVGIKEFLEHLFSLFGKHNLTFIPMIIDHLLTKSSANLLTPHASMEIFSHTSQWIRTNCLLICANFRLARHLLKSICAHHIQSRRGKKMAPAVFDAIELAPDVILLKTDMQCNPNWGQINGHENRSS